jgi:hypothetical protein
MHSSKGAPYDGRHRGGIMDETSQVGEQSGRFVDYRDQVGEICGNVVIPDQRSDFFVGCERENGEGAEEEDGEECLSGERI